MARTLSNMLPLGTKAPEFQLLDTRSGNEKNLEALRGEKGTLIMFLCNHCPFVKHVNPELRKLGEEYQEKGIGIVAISSNDVVKYPDDSPELMAKTAEEAGYTFPYLYDESQDTARAYDAACTPDFYLFDESLRLVYRGQLDDSRPGNDIPLSGKDLREAMNALLTGQPVPADQKPSIGCNIKWKEN